MSYLPSMPPEPGYYAYDPDMEIWVRFDYIVDMYAFRASQDEPCSCRVVEDPITWGII